MYYIITQPQWFVFCCGVGGRGGGGGGGGLKKEVYVSIQCNTTSIITTYTWNIKTHRQSASSVHAFRSSK